MYRAAGKMTVSGQRQFEKLFLADVLDLPSEVLHSDPRIILDSSPTTISMTSKDQIRRNAPCPIAHGHLQILECKKTHLCASQLLDQSAWMQKHRRWVRKLHVCSHLLVLLEKQSLQE